jgi:folate-dependent phosphoribosylglycinamide formyltransferase PurN
MIICIWDNMFIPHSLLDNIYIVTCTVQRENALIIKKMINNDVNSKIWYTCNRQTSDYVMFVVYTCNRQTSDYVMLYGWHHILNRHIIKSNILYMILLDVGVLSKNNRSSCYM